MAELREQIEREAAQTIKAHWQSPPDLLRSVIDLILEHRAQEAERSTVNFNATNADPGMRRARELRAMRSK